jgi:S-adenosylmethionine/arginine decarboxylase-like enzyme
VVEHKHLIVRAMVKNPPIKERLDVLGSWLESLVAGLNMKILSGPHVAYSELEGNRGATGVCIIETSHVIIHVWDEDDPAMVQLDVYTCGQLSEDVIVRHLKKFDPLKVEMMLLDREHKLDLVRKVTEYVG